MKVKLVNELGADKTMTAVLSGHADNGFMGAEASIYVYNEKILRDAIKIEDVKRW